MQRTILILLASAFAFGADAQDSTIAHQLGAVEITSTSNPDKSLLNQPASIIKLGEKELKRSTGLLLDDAINTNVPGVYMERRTFSAGQQFNIRGYGNGVRGTNGLNSNFDGQGYKVYLNNIPITDAEGITLMDDIDFGSLGNVEILKGPAGSLYGLAIAGAVNLKTVKPEKGKASVGQDVLVGSYGLQRYTTRLEIGGERSSLLVNYGKQLFDGYMSHTASRKDFVNIFGSFQPNKKQSLDLYIGYSNSYDQRNGELDTIQYRTQTYTGNPNYIANDAHTNVISYRAGVTHTYRFTQNISNATAVFGTGIVSNVSSAGGWTDKLPINYGLRSTVDMNFSFRRKIKLSGITGIEAQRQNAQTLGYAMVKDSFNTTGYNLIGALRSNQYTVSSTYSLFTEWTLALRKRITVTGGIGLSNMDIELNDRLYVVTNNNPSNSKGTHYPTRFKRSYGNMLSPHLAVNKVFRKQVSAYASLSSGYKAPVSSYFYIPLAGQTNTNLKPERGLQFEIGTKGALLKDKLHYEVAMFSATFSDKMTVVAVPNAANTATSYTYVTNGGRQDHKGIEAMVNYKLVATRQFAITPFVNFAYSDFKYRDFKFEKLSTDKKSADVADFSGKFVAGVPPVTFNVGADVNTRSGLYGNITYSYRDRIYFTSDNLNRTDAYSLLNAKAGFRKTVWERFDVDVFAGASNITGTQYYYMVFLNQLPDAYLPAPNEINFFGGVGVKYNFKK